MTPDLYHPVLDCFIRGLPHAFRAVDARPGTAVLLEIAGNCGGVWLLAKAETAWSFASGAPSQPAARVKIPQEIAWRVFTKGIDRAQALAQSNIEGDRALGERIFQLTAIVG
jgi:hypothetical protein